jgi:hypothetical protein
MKLSTDVLASLVHHALKTRITLWVNRSAWHAFEDRDVPRATLVGITGDYFRMAFGSGPYVRLHVTCDDAHEPAQEHLKVATQGTERRSTLADYLVPTSDLI